MRKWMWPSDLNCGTWCPYSKLYCRGFILSGWQNSKMPCCPMSSPNPQECECNGYRTYDYVTKGMLQVQWRLISWLWVNPESKCPGGTNLMTLKAALLWSPAGRGGSQRERTWCKGGCWGGGDLGLGSKSSLKLLGVAAGQSPAWEYKPQSYNPRNWIQSATCIFEANYSESLDKFSWQFDSNHVRP